MTPRADDTPSAPENRLIEQLAREQGVKPVTSMDELPSDSMPEGEFRTFFEAATGRPLPSDPQD
jgi:hypothetical protein